MNITCPHCLRDINLRTSTHAFESSESDSKGYTKWHATSGICPACTKLIVFFAKKFNSGGGEFWDDASSTLVWPKFPNRRETSSEVPEHYAKDYREACNVIDVSHNAAAALCRRCLQNILRSEFGITKKNLFEEIDDAVKTHKFPPQIEEELDAIRHSGNFAAHPLQSQSTGAIIDVERHEAEWCLEILADVFDFVFVQPAKRADRKAKLSTKLVDAGKNPVK